MSTTPTPAPSSKLLTILQVIQLALAGLKAVPVIGAASGLAGVFVGIFQNAVALYEAEAGQPFDITKIPIEQPLP